MENKAKTYLDVEDLQVYQKLCQLYIDIRMLNGLEKSIERHLSEKERRWLVTETSGEYGEPQELLVPGWPPPPPSNPEPLNTEH